MPTLNDVDPEGGDPPCWAHLFDELEDVCSDETQADGSNPAPLISQPKDGDVGAADAEAAQVGGHRHDPGHVPE
jgi:hypothetical protein